MLAQLIFKRKESVQASEITKLSAWNIAIAVQNILRFDDSKPLPFNELFPERPKPKPKLTTEEKKELFAARKLVLVE